MMMMMMVLLPCFCRTWFLNLDGHCRSPTSELGLIVQNYSLKFWKYYLCLNHQQGYAVKTSFYPQCCLLQAIFCKKISQTWFIFRYKALQSASGIVREKRTTQGLVHPPSNQTQHVGLIPEFSKNTFFLSLS